MVRSWRENETEDEGSKRAVSGGNNPVSEGKNPHKRPLASVPVANGFWPHKWEKFLSQVVSQVAA